ncbi:SMI1/KNR4 family protein [Pectobacterium parmentieri]|uniref:SMI1/KNR4 family protein n=1 Tax=Pectobacterium parmentieri TaxID=1905730 RepID=UPI000CDDFE65|nr:SMI1/KNR4 family protein [Pectobacterium parmentieri]AYH04171.1 cell wall assembly protein [Pectobacterium parmentieri]AYH12992.1 cell wall assembly protein [Pectobacterium parmentieri]AYH21694.1 cell wall assembly protein [Pectobacterium parmentieri]MBN3177179.1 SMI1/KNR4 family protein [Pectobacterium parmentieri]POW25055.1 cell wall assembly protein [Pectobacterium parmentieri]
MGIVEKDFVGWRMNSSNFDSNLNKVKSAIVLIENKLMVKLPIEFNDYLTLTNDEAIAPVRKKEYCLAKYAQGVRSVRTSVLFPSEQVIEYTKLSQESIYDERYLLPTGLIVIGSNYDGDSDSCIIYDVRPNSPTYLHVFNWRYYVDNVVVNEGLGLLAHSLKAFLSTPTAIDAL